MPTSVKTIGGYAFNGCEKLFIGDYGKKDSDKYVIEDFFKYIENIGQFSFIGTSITDLVISNSTISIGRRAFRGISSSLREHYLLSV